MKNKVLYAIWAAFYILCVGLGFIPEPSGLGKAILVITAILFFVPGAILLHRSICSRDKTAVLRIRLISIFSLSLTLILLLVNLISFLFPETLGSGLYVLLVLVSAPMVCSQYWVLSLFLWCCLLFYSFKRLSEA